MASTQAIRSRIKSAKNIIQITKAMEMISATKMRKSQARLVSAAPYAIKLRSVLQTLSKLISSNQIPFLTPRPLNSVLIVMISSDKGLAGSYNSNIFRESFTLEKRLTTAGSNVSYASIGKKARDFLRFTKRSVDAVFEGVGDVPDIVRLQAVLSFIKQGYLSGKYDAVYVVYSQSVSILVQKPISQQLLPISLSDQEKTPATQVPQFEPSAEVLLEWLLPYYIDQQLYYFMLQSHVSEHSARMMAMKNATDNAKEVRKELELMYNNARQAQITQQIAEIASATMI